MNTTQFEITFVKGLNWPKADTIGWCDPFCQFESDGVIQQTRHDVNTSEPKWDNQFIVQVDLNQTMKIECYDWDRVGKNDFIGSFEVNFSEFVDISISKNIKFDVLLQRNFFNKRKNNENQKSIKNQLRNVHIILQQWTNCLDYHVIYSSVCDEFEEQLLRNTLEGKENIMILVVGMNGELFGCYWNTIMKNGIVKDEQFFCYSLKYCNVTLPIKYSLEQSNSPCVIIEENSNILTVYKSFKLKNKEESIMNKEFKDYYDNCTEEIRIPEQFTIQCVFALEWQKTI
ncbi:C2 domain-containing protein [Entamoeba marina]